MVAPSKIFDRLPVPRAPRPHVWMLALALASTLPATAAFAIWNDSPPDQGRAKKATEPAPPPLPLHSLNCPASFITAMIPDGRGGVWVAGEDSGIDHWNAARKTWKTYNPETSPGLISTHI
ncbi:MAG: hypothetical protein HKL95_10720 [Phycisphaerae bacterium]|nr:hypothetical protein [Phycisphaerae bacterium]